LIALKARSSTLAHFTLHTLAHFGSLQTLAAIFQADPENSDQVKKTKF
jgi:hypothetical protein